MKLSAAVIARDEEKNIAGCLASLGFCDEIVVVDGGSRDRTVEIARAAGAQVFERPFTDFASQKNFAIECARGEWLLLVDADERPSEGLRREILETLERPRFDAYWVIRSNRIFGRWMRRGANAGDRQMRLVKRGTARFEGVVHERLRVDGPAGLLKEPLLHHSTASISAYMKKLNEYTALEVRECRARGRAFVARDLTRKPLARFVQLAFLKRGLEDGMEGFFFSALSAYYDFVRAAKQYEAENAPYKERAKL